VAGVEDPRTIWDWNVRDAWPKMARTGIEREKGMARAEVEGTPIEPQPSPDADRNGARVVRVPEAPASPTSSRGDGDLRWITHVLWGGSPGVSTSLEATGEPPGRLLESYAVLPNRSRPLLLAPLGSARAASAALLRYNALRPASRRAARALLGAGLRLGLAQPFLRDRLEVRASGPSDGREVDHLLLRDHLAGIFGRTVTTSVTVGRPGPFRKPTLQVLSPDGRVLGYAKVGWNDLTARLVRTEVGALGLCAERSPNAFAAPRVIHAGRWQGFELSVVTPLPLDARRYPPELGPPSLVITREVAELRAVTRQPLGESSFRRRLGERLDAVASAAAPAVGQALLGSLERLDRIAEGVDLAFGAWHGDWVPWNMARWRDRLLVWDWEQSVDVAPIGFDLLHFEFQLAFVKGRRSFADAAGRCRDRGLPLLAGLGLDTRTGRLVYGLYLLELFIRFEEAHLAGAGREPRFEPERVLDLFRDGARSVRGPA
jgi:hypothetical protein